MPPPVFNTANALLSHIMAQIAPNGNEEITGQRHQDVLVTLVNSLITILSGVPGQTVNDFPAWDSTATYAGGVEVVVRHNGSLWLMVSGTNSLGTEPGSNGLVWQNISAVQLAHFRNRDVYLDQGGPNEVTALALKRLLAARNAWNRPVDAIAPAPIGGEPIGYVYAVDEGATGAFAGYDGSLAERTTSGWSFIQIADGDTVRYRDLPDMLLRVQGSWFLFDMQTAMSTPGLNAVTAVGNSTSSGIVLSGAPLRHLGSMAGSYSHNSAGDVTINYATSCQIDLVMSANAVIKTASDVPGAEFWMTVRGTGAGGTITWDPTFWRKASGVTMPATVSGGQSYILHCISALGKAVVVACGEITTP